MTRGCKGMMGPLNKAENLIVQGVRGNPPNEPRRSAGPRSDVVVAEHRLERALELEIDATERVRLKERLRLLEHVRDKLEAP